MQQSHKQQQLLSTLVFLKGLLGLMGLWLEFRAQRCVLQMQMRLFPVRLGNRKLFRPPYETGLRSFQDGDEFLSLLMLLKQPSNSCNDEEEI